MAVALYYKDTTGALVEIETGGASKQVSASRSSVLTAGTVFTVPKYPMGQGRLQVFLDGLLCIEGAGNQYIENTDTSIKFNDNIPTDMEIVALVL